MYRIALHCFDEPGRGDHPSAGDDRIASEACSSATAVKCRFTCLSVILWDILHAAGNGTRHMHLVLGLGIGAGTELYKIHVTRDGQLWGSLNSHGSCVDGST